MSLVQHTSATVAHVIHPSPYRAAVLGRRISASPEVAAVLALMAYGEPRDPMPALPSSVGRARP